MSCCYRTGHRAIWAISSIYKVLQCLPDVFHFFSSLTPFTIPTEKEEDYEIRIIIDDINQSI